MIIRQKRLAMGLLQRELAGKAGWDTSYLGMTELGRKNPSLDKLISLSEVLNCDVTEILKYSVCKDNQEYYNKCKKPIIDYFALQGEDMAKIASDMLDSLRLNVKDEIIK